MNTSSELVIECTVVLSRSGNARRSPAEREVSAVLRSVGYFRPYVWGRKSTLITDSSSLIWLVGSQSPFLQAAQERSVLDRIRQGPVVATRSSSSPALEYPIKVSVLLRQGERASTRLFRTMHRVITGTGVRKDQHWTAFSLRSLVQTKRVHRQQRVTKELESNYCMCIHIMCHLSCIHTTLKRARSHVINRVVACYIVHGYNQSRRLLRRLKL